MTSRRLAPLLAGILLLAGCSFPGSGPKPDKAADRLAVGLSSYDLEGVEFTDPTATRELEKLVAPLRDLPTKVRVGEIDTDGDKATVTLEWETEAGTGTWQRTTTATLRKKSDQWLVVAEPTLVADAIGPGDRIAVSTVKAARGRILGAGGVPIVKPRPVLRIGIDKTKVRAGQARRSAQELARVLDIDAGKFSELVAKSGPKAFVPALVVRRQGLAADYGLRFSRIAGAVALSDHLPLAPTKEFAAQILGTVGPATAELIEKGKGRLRPGDDTGLSGLQLRYDEQLAGKSGLKVSAVPEESTDEQEPEVLFESQPRAGSDLEISLDPALQTRADDLLADIGPASAIVAVRPSTGELVAIASGPGSNGYNTATFGQYAPGSTFKVVSALALLRAGLEPSTEIPCTPTTTVDGKGFKNYDDYPSDRIGSITLEGALANSCNTAFISQRDELDDEALAEAAASLGVGVDHDTGFPAYFGAVPPAASEVELAADMIGQGKVLASPMAMSAVLASVMSGRTVVPHLVEGKAPKATPGKALSGAEASALRQMTGAVVREGSGSFLQSLGSGVLAKTGTAEFGTEVPLQTHAWMIGGREDLAVAVFVGIGESGSQTAGPILEAFLQGASAS